MSPPLRRLSSLVVLAGAVLALAGLPGCGGDSGSGTTAAAGTGTAAGHAQAPPAPRRVARLIPPSGAPSRTVHVPVLTYHRVAPLRAGANAIETDLTVDPATFVGSMRALRAAGFHTVTQEQIFDALWHGAALPARPVLLTFDDGYVDDVRRILPVLRRDHMVATFFIITGRFHEPGFLTAAQVRELDHAGMDIGDHTRSHLDLTAMAAPQLAVETAGSRRALERVVGHPVYAFAYPSGRNDPVVRAAVGHAGFTMAYTTAYGTTLSSTAPLEMPRLHVGRAATPASVVALAGS